MGELTKAIADATRAAVTELFHEHRGEHFYYCALITTGEALAPVLTAWSTEALDAAAGGNAVARAELKWSYADSPYYHYGEAFFGDVRMLFENLPPLENEAPTVRSARYEFRMGSMVAAMKQLDQEGLFANAPRSQIVVNVECMPPDSSNAERANQLNPPEALTDWLKEAAEG